MSMPTKYSDDVARKALAMRAAGEKMIVVQRTFGAGIEGAMRRVRELDAGPELLARIEKAHGPLVLIMRKADKALYRIYRTRGRVMGGRSAAYLVPKWDGKSHWKTHERILLDFTYPNGDPL